MNKQEFLTRLRVGLSVLPQEDAEERLSFYAEMIEDRMEEGLSEQEAVSAIGSIDEVVAQIIADTPLTQLVKQKLKSPKRRSSWSIVLIVLGSPIWFSLLIAAFAVASSLYVSLWAVVICLWAVFVSLVGCFIGGLAGGVYLAVIGHLLSGLSLIAAGLVCAGLSILSFFGCRAITGVAVNLGKQMVLWFKHCFIRKGDNQ